VDKKKQLIIFWGLLCIYSFTIAFGFVLGCQKAPESNDKKPKASVPAQKTKFIVEKKEIKIYVTKLTDEKFAGRRAGTRGEAEAALYLAQQFKKIGLKPGGENNTYFQSFPIPRTGIRQDEKRAKFYILSDKSELLADNVLGIIESKKRPTQYILLSAHFDHLGVWKNKLYPGANDNASGVAAILEITRALKEKEEELPYSFLIAFWSGEEMGLLGSNYFINHPTIQLKNIKLAINLDSIGIGPDNDFILWSEAPEQQIITDLKTELSKWENINFTSQYSTENTSDHQALAQGDIPALTILAENWLDSNHSPLDSPVLLNFNKITTLAEKIVNFVGSAEIVKITEVN